MRPIPFLLSVALLPVLSQSARACPFSSHQGKDAGVSNFTSQFQNASYQGPGSTGVGAATGTHHGASGFKGLCTGSSAFMGLSPLTLVGGLLIKRRRP